MQPGFVSPYSPPFFSPSPFCCIFQSTKHDTRELSEASLPPWQAPECRGVIQDSISPFKNIPTRFSLLRISMSSVWSVPGALGTEQKQPHEQGEGAELSAGQHKELRGNKPPAPREGDHYCQLFQLRKLHTSFITALYTHPWQPRLHCQAAWVLVDTPDPVLILQEGCLFFFVFKASVQYSNAPPKSIFTHSTSTVVRFTSQKNKHGMHLCGQALSPDSPQGTVFLSHICSRHQILSSAAFSVGGCGSHPVTLQQGVHRSRFNSTSYLPETLTKKISGSARSHVATRTRLSRHQHLKGGGSEPFEQKHPTADKG